MSGPSSDGFPVLVGLKKKKNEILNPAMAHKPTFALNLGHVGGFLLSHVPGQVSGGHKKTKRLD